MTSWWDATLRDSTMVMPSRSRRFGWVVLCLMAGLWAVQMPTAGGQQRPVPRLVVEPS